MTILGLKTQIVTHFTTCDYFCASKHLEKLSFDQEISDHYKELVLFALHELEEINLIKKIDGGSETIWILNAPLAMLSQPIYLSRNLADHVAEVINKYNELEKIDVESDPSKLTEHDIHRLVDIIDGWEGDSLENDDGDDKNSGDLSQYNPGVN